MLSLILLSSTACILALVLTSVCRKLATAAGLVDIPDRKRKVHTTPVPRVGGVAVAAAYVFSFALFLPLALSGLLPVPENLSAVWRLLPAILVIFLTGLADDVLSLTAVQKLGGQLVAAILAYAGGVRITNIAGFEIPVWLGVAITVGWLAGCANALNLIDGLDGLAAGVGLVASLTTFVAALIHGDRYLALATAPLIGALLGFLCYNFPPATIFLGDCGSLLIGFLLGCYAVIWSGKSATLLGMSAPAIALALPLIDTSLAIVRRFIRRQPIFGADRGHIHHRLLDRGLTPKRASLVLYGCCALAAAISLLQSCFHRSYGGLCIVLFCMCAAAGISWLRYIEFEVLGRLLARGAFRSHVNTHVHLAGLHAALARAEDPSSCWRAVRETCSQLGFTEVRLKFGALEFGETLRETSGQTWSARIPLSPGQDSLCLRREFGSGAPEAAAALADELRASLVPKLAAFRQSDLVMLLHFTGLSRPPEAVSEVCREQREASSALWHSYHN